ncbi:MAG: hypothetical protein NTW86_08150 [Candidatus Sumerlaeota bacterium]|nr:hypothetical protein [Candidatus Sumerlaeota bacterium]
MSIYATLWTLKFPKEGDDYHGCEWIEVMAQSVPAHIGSPTPGCGYEEGDPYASFLPPAIETDENGEAPFMRAVVFVTERSLKGTERSPQEYAGPLLALTGEEYSRMPFEELHRRLCDVLRGNRAPVVAQFLGPDGTVKIIRGKLKEHGQPDKATNSNEG